MISGGFGFAIDLCVCPFCGAMTYPLRSSQIMVAIKVNYCYLHGVVRGVEVGRPRHRAYRA